MVIYRPMPHDPGPYRVEEVQTPQGLCWRLVGPGLDNTRAYPWAEAKQRLAELADMMNFAWRQSEGRPQPPGPEPSPEPDSA